MTKPKSATAITTNRAELARLRRRAGAFERYDEGYEIVRACAAMMKRLRDAPDRATERELKRIGLSVLQRFTKDMRSTGDGTAIFKELRKAIGTVIPQFSKTLFKTAPRTKKEKPALERPVSRVKLDASLDQPALAKIARGVKSDEIETPEALRWYAKFAKAAPLPATRRDAWRRGRALLQGAQREARNNNFLAAYYEKKLAKYEPAFAEQPG